MATARSPTARRRARRRCSARQQATPRRGGARTRFTPGPPSTAAQLGAPSAREAARGALVREVDQRAAGSGAASRSTPTRRGRGGRRRPGRTRPPGRRPRRNADRVRGAVAADAHRLAVGRAPRRPSRSATHVRVRGGDTTRAAQMNVRATSMSGIARIWARMLARVLVRAGSGCRRPWRMRRAPC